MNLQDRWVVGSTASIRNLGVLIDSQVIVLTENVRRDRGGEVISKLIFVGTYGRGGPSA